MPTTYAIPNGSTAFAATLYTGNGGTQSITNTVNGVSMQPDFVWVKDRTAAGTGHYLTDVLRGVGYMLQSDTTAAEVNRTAGSRVSAFNSNGFSVVHVLNTDTNANGDAYVGWQWKANGAAVTNTAGSITSQVSANTTAGFSVVTYTGTGANATVGHGLGVAPSMVIVKRRDAGSSPWNVWQTGLSGGTYFLVLSATSAQANGPTRFTATPTSTLFNIGTDSDVNASAGTHVAYCFAAVPGYSAFGSYTGNGSTDGVFVYTGFRPRWVMVKRTDTAGYAWVIIDTARSTYNQVALSLYANVANADQTSDVYDILSNGFKLRTTDPANNASGGSYVYACFAEMPFKYANGR